jgi:hypothetical protein
MLMVNDIRPGLKIGSSADLGWFVEEGTEGVAKAVQNHEAALWHAAVLWRDVVRRRKIQGVLKPKDLDYVEIVPQKYKRIPAAQLAIPFPD